MTTRISEEKVLVQSAPQMRFSLLSCSIMSEH